MLVWASRPAWADSKEECVSAADRGQQARDEGKYRLAREAFIACARSSCPGMVARSCAQWLRDVDAAMPSIVVGARDEKGADVVDARVLVDGELLADKLDGRLTFIDPGEHLLRLERTGEAPQEQHVVIRASEKNRIIVFKVGSATGADQPAATGRRPQGPSPETPQATERTADSFFTTRNTVVLSLVGLAAIAVGSAVYLGVQSRSNADAAAHYRATNAPNACVGVTTSLCESWSDAVDAENRDAMASDVLYVAGGALAVGAVVTWLVWPSRPAQPASGMAWLAPAMGPGRIGLGAGGSF